MKLALLNSDLTVEYAVLFVGDLNTVVGDDVYFGPAKRGHF